MLMYLKLNHPHAVTRVIDTFCCLTRLAIQNYKVNERLSLGKTHNTVYVAFKSNTVPDEFRSKTQKLQNGQNIPVYFNP